MRRALLLLIALLCLAAPCLAQKVKIQGIAQTGGAKIITAGITSTTSSVVTYPGSTITVFQAGTSNPATLYADSSGTPSGNTRTAGSDASYSFYTDPGVTIDIQFSGTGIASPYTLGGMVSPGFAGSTQVLCGGTNDTTLLTTANASGGIIQIPNGITCATNNITISTALQIDKGGLLKPLTGQTATLTGPQLGGIWQRFTNALAGQGTISFANNHVMTSIYLEWWGGAGDNSTINDSQWTAATAALATANGGVLQFSSGTYKFSKDLTIPTSNNTFRGLGPGATLISFSSSSYPVQDRAFYIQGTTSSVTNISITAANNANPVTLTTAGYQLTNGQAVTISGATGNWATGGTFGTGINGTWQITKTGANTFTIPFNSSTSGALTGSPVVSSDLRAVTGAIAVGATSLTATNGSTDTTGVVAGDWVVIQEADATMGDLYAFDMMQVASVTGGGATVNFYHPFRTAFAGTHRGVAFRKLSNVPQNNTIRDLKVTTTDANNEPAIAIGWSRNTLIENVIATTNLGQPLFTYQTQGLTIRAFNQQTQTSSSTELAAVVDLTISDSQFSSIGATSSTSALDLDIGTAFFSIIGCKIETATNIGIQVNPGVHDGSIIGNTITYVRDGGIGGNGILGRGVQRVIVANNILDGGAGAATGITWSDSTGLTTPTITSIDNIIGPNIVRNFATLYDNIGNTNDYVYAPVNTFSNAIASHLFSPSVTVKGVGQNTPNLTANYGGANLFLDSTNNTTGSGGALLIGDSDKLFAAIKGYLTSGNNNSAGDLTISTRNVFSDAALTESLRVNNAGALSIRGSFNYSNDTGAADAYVVTLATPPLAYAAGMQVIFIAANANTGAAATLNVNGLGAKSLVRGVNTTPTVNFIKVGSVVVAIYDGTRFQMIQPAAQ